MIANIDAILHVGRESGWVFILLGAAGLALVVDGIANESERDESGSFAVAVAAFVVWAVIGVGVVTVLAAGGAR